MAIPSTEPQLVEPAQFFNAIDAAKNYGKKEEKTAQTINTVASKWFGAYVHSYTIEEYKETKPYLFDDGKAGFAIKNGDIVSVFKHPNCTLKPALDVTIPAAIARQGNRLDCFNGMLPSMYAKYGFLPYAKLKFNNNHAPADWNYARDNAPDIIYMAYSINNIIPNEASQDRISRINDVILKLSFSGFGDISSIQQKVLGDNGFSS